MWRSSQIPSTYKVTWYTERQSEKLLDVQIYSWIQILETEDHSLWEDQTVKTSELEFETFGISEFRWLT